MEQTKLHAIGGYYMPSEERSEGRIKIGRLGYFIQRGRTTGTRSAVYFGPNKSSDGVHRHITAVFDTVSGDLDNLHLTKEGQGKEVRNGLSILIAFDPTWRNGFEIIPSP